MLLVDKEIPTKVKKNPLATKYASTDEIEGV